MHPQVHCFICFRATQRKGSAVSKTSFCATSVIKFRWCLLAAAVGGCLILGVIPQAGVCGGFFSPACCLYPPQYSPKVKYFGVKVRDFVFVQYFGSFYIDILLRTRMIVV